MIEFKNVSFCYKDSEQSNSLHNINFHISKGEVVLLCGKSGCGKTTITRLINGLIPNYYEGEIRGEVVLDERQVSGQPIAETAKSVGSVFQNPRSQFFNVDTTSELVFGCENMGWNLVDIEKKLGQVTRDFRIENLLGRNLFHLSGGEKQKIACAAVTMSDPEILVLDEPASNLDWKAIRMLSDIVGMWKAKGKTVIIAEHRLGYLKQVADRVIYMENGRIIQDVTAKEFWALSPEEIRGRGLRSINTIEFPESKTSKKDKINLEFQNFQFGYQKVLNLDIETLSVPKGVIVGVIGNNGAGKTTFARCLCGLERHAIGQLKMEEKIYKRQARLKNSYLVMQDVNHQLFTESVEEEVLIGMPGKEENNRLKGEEILRSMDLFQLKDLHPLSLSGGQKQRVAVASALSSHKEILVFDEPTSGLDYHHMIEVADNLKKLSEMGKTLFIITHDPELIAECCNYIIFMEQGKVLWDGTLMGENKEKVEAFFSTV